ncbi:ABC transporter permease [Halorussus halophilus]|uniref:ABC transporter permease n=1 Tax=Halorussus halophilus TaxID=2650975 RepID=UPI0013016F4F|nr:ABC transporter permease [Halorussus halophilus]
MNQFVELYDDLEEVDSGLSRLARRDWAFAGYLLTLLALFFADREGVFKVDSVVFSVDFTGLDWLFLYSLGALVCYLVVPLVTNRERSRTYWRRLRQNRWATASFFVLVAFTVVGLVGPVVFKPNEAAIGSAGVYGVPIGQPPVGFSILESAAPTCAGEVTNGRCHGTWTYPFGTTRGGKDVVGMTVAGTRIALEMAAVAIALIVPLATVVGTTAATYGGRIDELLMRYVDVQQSVPAFFVIILTQEALNHITEGLAGSFFLIVLVFGLLSWGGVARIVRSEALQLQEEGYVRAARSSGASKFAIVRKHVVPNTLNAVLTAVTLQVGWLILLEATLAFLGIGSDVQASWGYVLTTSARSAMFPTSFWWGVFFPTAALALTVVSFQVLGDALCDVTDPRTE